MGKLTQKTIRAKAPMRFDLAGGPTDVSPFSDLEGGNVVNLAIQKYAFVYLSPRKDNTIKVKSLDLGKESSHSLLASVEPTGPLRLLKASLAYLLPEEGINLVTWVDAPKGSGLGASASLAVALIGALRVFRDDSFSYKTLAHDALYIENELLKNINGGQDQYAASLGGINFYGFSPEGIELNPLIVKPDVIKEFENKSLLVHSGESRVSGEIITKVMKDYVRKKPGVATNLRRIRKYAQDMANMLESGDLAKMGVVIDAVFSAQKQLHASVVTPKIEEIFQISNSIGIEGGKIAGAGGGGTVLLYADKKNKEAIKEMLKQRGYTTSSLLVSSSGFQYSIT